jgi:hypothetical protein
VLRLAVAPELDGVTGAYFNRQQPARPDAQAADPRARAALWRLSLALCGLPEDSAG